MNQLNIDTLKDNHDLREIVAADLGSNGKPGGAARLHFCPFHDNTRTPALSVWSNGFKCWSCQASGDLITWLQDYRKLSFREAIQYLGGNFEGETRIAPRPRPAPVAQSAPDWQPWARDAVQICKKNLFANKKALAWLTGPERRLTMTTIDAWDLGYSPGVKIQDIWIERGIVIPWQSFGEIWRINIRRPVGDPKYRQIKGSRGGLFGIETCQLNQPGYITFIAEGEFDAMQLWHVIANHNLNAGVITTGGATTRINAATWGKYLLESGSFIAAFDLDQAGAQGFKSLCSYLGNRAKCAKLPPDIGGQRIKDITDFVKAGGDLYAWTQYQMEVSQ